MLNRAGLPFKKRGISPATGAEGKAQTRLQNTADASSDEASSESEDEQQLSDEDNDSGDLSWIVTSLG